MAGKTACLFSHYVWKLYLYESPVMSVIEGIGFHPWLSRPAGMVVTKAGTERKGDLKS